MRTFYLKVVVVLIGVAVTFALALAYKSTSTMQLGNPGLGMETVRSNKDLDSLVNANKAPRPLPPASQEGQLSVDAYKNVQVLGHITSGEMTRLMTAMNLWVSPQQGCAYCHAPKRDASGKVLLNEDGYPIADENKLDSDELYTKVVARRMLQMTMHVNKDWQTHVKRTGVTCYTCHRGQPVPAAIWYDESPDARDATLVGSRGGQNLAAAVAGYTSLPSDFFRPFLAGEEQLRVISTEALPIDNRLSIKQAEWTYGLMMHMSQALNVPCTHCHNSRSFGAWDASPIARTQAWYGIRLARDLNLNYLEPLRPTFPPERLGPTGDAPKLNCTTCHQGAYRPLLGESMLKDYAVLAEAKPQPQKTQAAPAAPPDVTPQTPPAPGAPPTTPPN